MNSGDSSNRPARSKILLLDDAYAVIDAHKARSDRVVFTNGCFDLLHPGHTRYLTDARKLGDVLIVAINSDRSVRELKGDGRPIFPQEERAEILAALKAVDYVTVFDDPTPREVIARMLPHVLVKGAGWGPNEIVGRKEVEAAGGRVVSMPAVPGFSTTCIVNAVQKIFA
ncbi:MAG TPA: D-glycero-beta-D-manno-heptose 1-phosphate adenylyltransferase [Terriglobia bacterium]|nr:D-glycero-beta-D-manno-heptose 1-phosphate adenylyltransferase [Terriglobia bacterium]